MIKRERRKPRTNPDENNERNGSNIIHRPRRRKKEAEATPKTIGYLRVSTKDQDLEKNKDEILRFVNQRQFGNVQFVEEQVSGTVNWHKRKINDVIDELGANDTLVVSELTRLGRSTLEVLEILRAAKAKEINVYSVKEGMELNGSIQAKVMATMLALFSELERDFISLRTKEALKAKKAAGVQLGRPKGPGKSKLDKHEPEIISLLKTGASKKYIADRYVTSPGNLHNWLKKRNINIKPDPQYKIKA
jgi:DNA invertase Pin-like site-specific DNA recombinase